MELEFTQINPVAVWNSGACLDKCFQFSFDESGHACLGKYMNLCQDSAGPGPIGAVIQSLPLALPLLWYLYVTKGGPGDFDGTKMSLVKKLVSAAFVFSVGAIMPSFLLMGWSRDARTVDDIFHTSASLANLHFNRSSFMYRNLSRGVPNLEDVIILGESERGVDFESHQWQEDKNKRDFIRQVGLKGFCITDVV